MLLGDIPAQNPGCSDVSLSVPGAEGSAATDQVHTEDVTVNIMSQESQENQDQTRKNLYLFEVGPVYMV